MFGAYVPLLSVVCVIAVVLNYVFLNAPPVLNLTEGESYTLNTGLSPSLSIETRGTTLVARIQSESGTALGKC